MPATSNDGTGTSLPSGPGLMLSLVYAFSPPALVFGRQGLTMQAGLALNCSPSASSLEYGDQTNSVR